MTSKHPKPWDKDLRFVLKALVVSACIMLVLHIARFSFVRSEMPEEVTQLAGEVSAITPPDALSLIKRANKPTLLYVYASWCGYCRQVTPRIVEMLKKGELGDTQFLLLSLDRDYYNFANYLYVSGFSGAFTPYVLRGNSAGSLGKVLAPSGSRYDNRIPYTALFDASGMVAAENLGGRNWQEFISHVKNAIPPAAASN